MAIQDHGGSVVFLLGGLLVVALVAQVVHPVLHLGEPIILLIAIIVNYNHVTHLTITAFGRHLVRMGRILCANVEFDPIRLMIKLHLIKMGLDVVVYFLVDFEVWGPLVRAMRGRIVV